MTREVNCHKLKKTLAGFERPPYPGPIGKRIYEEISQDAWQMWLSHQTILINEYRLNLSEKTARDFLAQEMEKFLFGDGSEVPGAFVAPGQD